MPICIGQAGFVDGGAGMTRKLAYVLVSLMVLVQLA